MDELKALAKEAERVTNDKELTWQAKYDLIFSETISRRVFKLAPRFDYYDPDTSYKEDVYAFTNSLKSYLYG